MHSLIRTSLKAVLLAISIAAMPVAYAEPATHPAEDTPGHPGTDGQPSTSPTQTPGHKDTSTNHAPTEVKPPVT